MNADKLDDPLCCLQEKFQPYFADAGYDNWAVSLRGQGGSDPVQGASVAGALSTLCCVNSMLAAAATAAVVLTLHFQQTLL